MSYLKEHKNLTYQDFLYLNRDVIITLLPFTKDWNSLDSAWSNRFMQAVKTHVSDRFETIRKKVCLFLFIFNFI